MKNLFKAFATGGAFVLLQTVAGIQSAEAAFKLPVSGNGITGSAGGSDVAGTATSIGTQIINIVLVLAGLLAVLFLIYNGIQYIISAGNADKVKLARGGIINAVIGIVVIVAAYGIVNFAIRIGGAAGNTLNTNGSGSSGGSTGGF